MKNTNMSGNRLKTRQLTVAAACFIVLCPGGNQLFYFVTVQVSNKFKHLMIFSQRIMVV